jgi:hypothetical protein
MNVHQIGIRSLFDQSKSCTAPCRKITCEGSPGEREGAFTNTSMRTGRCVSSSRCNRPVTEPVAPGNSTGGRSCQEPGKGSSLSGLTCNESRLALCSPVAQTQNLWEERKRKTNLTLTGLLMEGLGARPPLWFRSAGALAADSLCRGQEKRMMRRPEVPIGNSGWNPDALTIRRRFP